MKLTKIEKLRIDYIVATIDLHDVEKNGDKKEIEVLKNYIDSLGNYIDFLEKK